MTTEIVVLRALLRFARRSRPDVSLADLAGFLRRDGADPADLPRALGALARGGLVQRTEHGPRLSLAGLAFAVATGATEQRRTRVKRDKTKARARIVARPRITALERRRRAA